MLSWLPVDVSTFGREIDSLFYLIYYITGATFILVTFLMILFLVMYRQKEGRRATYSHGNTTLEIVWTIIHEAALTILTRTSVTYSDDLAAVLRGVTAVVARTLEVARVGVWRLNEHGTSMSCYDLFEWPASHASRRAAIPGTCGMPPTPAGRFMTRVLSVIANWPSRKKPSRGRVAIQFGLPRPALRKARLDCEVVRRAILISSSLISNGLSVSYLRRLMVSM